MLRLFPYRVTGHYDLAYVVEDVRSGKKYGASVSDR
jgi:hypothetical protein